MSKPLDVVGTICRYALAVVACVSLAQFLLLLGVQSVHAKELAGETLARAVFCGAIAAWWFYRERRKDRPKYDLQNSLRREQPTQQRVEVDPAVESSGSQTVPQIAEPASLDTGPFQIGENTKYLFIFLAVFLVLLVVFMIESKPKETPDLGGSRQLHEQVVESPRNSQPTVVSACGTGVPAGIETVPIKIAPVSGERYDLAPKDSVRLSVAGSEGRAWYDPTDHTVDYTPDQFAAHGYSATSYEVGQWYFSFKVTNNTADVSSQPRLAGYCITTFQYDVAIRSDDGRIWRATGTQNTNDRPLSPGWWQEYTRVRLSLGSRPKNGSLNSWGVSKAWGYLLRPDERATTEDRANKEPQQSR